MATVVPPPSKRQKRQDLERTVYQQDVTAATSGPEGSFKARFLDGDGNQMSDVVEVPLAHASEKNLSVLLNTMMERVRRLGFTSACDLAADRLHNRIAKSSCRTASEFTYPTRTLLSTNTLPISSNSCATMESRTRSRRQ